MRSAVLVAVLAPLVLCEGRQNGMHDPHQWLPAGDNDLRGPCPMMNTLSNHGYLPRDGRNITKDNAVAALKSGLNFEKSLGELMWERAIIANPEPNATYFTLDHLNRHNVLEHDASLSRTDAYFGSNHVFNQSIFDTSKRYWTEQTITAKMMANSKISRQVESRAFNPDYAFDSSVEDFSIGEVSAPFVAFGDVNTGLVERDLVLYFFENERLPFELGWTQKETEVSLKDILAASAVVRNALSLITDQESSYDEPASQRDLHSIRTAGT